VRAPVGPVRLRQPVAWAAQHLVLASARGQARAALVSEGKS